MLGEVLEGPLGAPWRSPGASEILGGVPGVPRGSLGGPWAVPGASLGSPWGSLGVPGGSLGAPGQVRGGPWVKNVDF